MRIAEMERTEEYDLTQAGRVLALIFLDCAAFWVVAILALLYWV
jgi:hypothetical protein